MKVAWNSPLLGGSYCGIRSVRRTVLGWIEVIGPQVYISNLIRFFLKYDNYRGRVG